MVGYTYAQRRYHHLPPPALIQYNAHVFLVYSCAGTLLVIGGSVARRDSAGWPACEECGRRLSRCKGKLHRHGPGHVCQRCYNQQRHSTAVAAPSVAPAVHKQSRKRRAESDPGEHTARLRTPSPRRTRLAVTKRVTPPKPSPPRNKARTAVCRTRTEEDIMRMLDETNARRIAAEAAAAQTAGAAATAATAGERGTTHTGFAMVFVP